MVSFVVIEVRVEQNTHYLGLLLFGVTVWLPWMQSSGGMWYHYTRTSVAQGRLVCNFSQFYGENIIREVVVEGSLIRSNP